MLAFVHLSDIHLNKYSGDEYDIDLDLRNEILRDIELEYPLYIKNATGILLCGDIAFSGQQKEYLIAKKFIKEIVGLLQIKETNVYTVPGNHDVDQSIVRENPILYHEQSRLGNLISQDEFDNEFASMLRSKIGGQALYVPLEKYNEFFAVQYNCDIGTDRPYWKEYIDLIDGYKLALWGINSTLLSNHEDHKDFPKEREMRISKLQIPKREKNIIYMTLCHHPPKCWNDPNNDVFNLLKERVSVQLYGHKHMQTISALKNTVIIGSGAAHPSRKESDWLPRYNWITIELIKEQNIYFLELKIYPRIWEKSKFVCDKYSIENKQLNYFSHKIEISESFHSLTPEKNDENNLLEKNTEISKYKDFIYSFINLPILIRQSIMEKYGLYKPEYDAGIEHSKMIYDIIERAIDKGCMELLRDEVHKRKEN